MCLQSVFGERTVYIPIASSCALIPFVTLIGAASLLAFHIYLVALGMMRHWDGGGV